MFLGSMALYFASREIGRRFHLRNEPSLLSAVVSLLAAESFSVVLLLFLAGARPSPSFGARRRPSGSPGPP